MCTLGSVKASYLFVCCVLCISMNSLAFCSIVISCLFHDAFIDCYNVYPLTQYSLVPRHCNLLTNFFSQHQPWKHIWFNKWELFVRIVMRVRVINCLCIEWVSACHSLCFTSSILLHIWFHSVYIQVIIMMKSWSVQFSCIIWLPFMSSSLSYG